MWIERSLWKRCLINIFIKSIEKVRSFSVSKAEESEKIERGSIYGIRVDPPYQQRGQSLL